MAGETGIDRALGRTIFGSDTPGYDRARPGYPDELYDVLVARCGLGRGSRVLEIGPGTGQATRRLDALGALVTVVEPDPLLAGFVESALPGVDVRNAAFEEAELEPGGFDLVVAATSFHWVDPDVGVGRVFAALRPGGWCALWWNVFGDWARPDPFVPATDHLFARAGLQDSTHPSVRFERDYDARLADLAGAGFEEVAVEELRWSPSFDAEQLRALTATYSSVRALDEARRAELLDGIARVAREEFGDVVERAFVTIVYTARRPASR